MATSIANSLSTSGASTGKTAANDKWASLSSDQFTKIMMAELQAQDPLKPNDSNTLLQQVSSLRSIESNLSLENKLSSILTQNQLATAGNLIGANVTGKTAQNNQQSGQVISVAGGSGGVRVILAGGWEIPFSNIERIDLAMARNPTTPPTSTPPATTPPATTPPATTPPVVTPPSRTPTPVTSVPSGAPAASQSAPIAPAQPTATTTAN